MTPTADNVRSVLRSATDAQILIGSSWYDEAHDFCVTTAHLLDVSVEVVAGVTAAGSPLVSWGLNKRNTLRWLSQGYADRYLGAGCRKAERIMAGENPIDVLTSDKVSAFYAGILTRGQTDRVCVDRHAHDVAVGIRYKDAERPKIGKRLYRACANAYVEAAEGTGYTPAEVQAIAWVTWRNRYWSEGAFDTV